MATIDILLTQAAYNNALLLDDGADGGVLLDDLTAMLAGAAAGVQDDSADVSNYVSNGGVFRFNFPDGSYDEFTGVVLAPPGALRGTATATGANLFVPGAGVSHQTGLYSFSYDLTGPVPTAQRISALTNTVTIESQIAASAPQYDDLLGNGKLQVTGAVTVDAAGILGGTVSAMTLTADKVLASASVTGTFNLSGITGSIEDGTGSLGIAGTLSGAEVVFKDGSYARAGGLAAHVDGQALADPLGLFTLDGLAGNDAIRVELPATLQADYTIAAGLGNDSITVAGGGGRLDVAAGDGNDRIVVLSDHHDIDGGAGFDTLAYSGARSAYTISRGAAGVEIRNASGADLVTNVERVQFGSAVVAFDIDGNAGQAYRLYQAAFNRTPDSAGLGYWVGILDAQHTLHDMATGFINSAEFTTLYGAASTDAAFLTRLYDNVLHRAYDQAGFDYWMDVLGDGAARAGVLASFSESAENQAQVLGAIQNGIEFTPYLG
jgi:hypothetical protein